MNQIITHLTDYQYSRGILSLFLYTKCEAAHFFSDLGFYEITRVQNKLVFMENRKHGFDHYLEQLIQETTLQTAHFSETDDRLVLSSSMPIPLRLGISTCWNRRQPNAASFTYSWFRKMFR